MSQPDRFRQQWDSYRQRAETALPALLPDAATATRLGQAMAYTCLAGGKRFRAVLVYACGELAGVNIGQLDTAACAVEMVHAYSLVHDDLPAMDDDTLRRGKPTCHIAYDEATAILAGDALQSQAFELIAAPEHNPVAAENRVAMVQTLARAIGIDGMAGGQSLDISATAKAVSRAELATIYRLKTGALIEAAAAIGVLAAPVVDTALKERVHRYAAALGQAFQIYDDVLDAVSDAETMGKNPGADRKMKKSTYVSLFGLAQAEAEAQKLARQATQAISGLGHNADFLEALARFAITRRY